ncbi:MAG TPA: protein kinase [Steroidobacteraceae bacterium]|nr:protein kinase [Steroidobacteraceae bacterium]
MSEAATANGGAPLRDRYVLREKLGAGGQGEVWRAFDPQTGADVALKLLTPSQGRSAAAWVALVHEHESASRLDHPGILKMFPPERDGTTFILPMELAAGGDLRRLRGAGYLAIVPVLIEVAQALEHAHERGVIHRDLKPGNVLFDERGRVKLADFGVSGRTIDPGTDALVRGLSPFTASPEQLRGEPPRPADDIYGLGALAYELLSRYPPHYPHFDAQRVQQDPAPPLVPAQQIPPQLDALIMSMLAKDPRQRPGCMRDVIDELDASLNDTLTFDFETAESAANETHPPDQPTIVPAQPLIAAAEVPEARTAQPVSAASSGPASAERPAPPPEPMLATPRRGAIDGEALWEEVRQAPLPRRTDFKPVRRGLPWALGAFALLAFVALIAFVWLPRMLPGSQPEPASVLQRSPAPVAGSPDAQQLAALRAAFEQRLTALEARGAGIWGGADFAAAKARAAEAQAAREAGNAALGAQRLAEAGRLLDTVQAGAPAALASELAAGDRALAAGQQELAAQSYDLAARIDPQDARARAGQARARELTGVLPLLADAQNAAGSGNYARAIEDYTQALKIDPQNADARAGLAKTNAAYGDDAYAKAAGAGFAALGAGRLDEARAAFQRAAALRPNGAEAADGLKRVDAARRTRGFDSLRTRAADLEADERWDEALAAYNTALRQDPSLEFAQEGKERAAARAELNDELQALIDRPDRLGSPDVRAQASKLLQSAEQQPSPGPVLRLQIARVAALLPEFEKPVHVSLVSDSLTQVAIPSIGSFGSFSRRDVELKPGRYTVIGTRDGYRDVRRDITVSPGQTQTISVSCYEPI